MGEWSEKEIELIRGQLTASPHGAENKKQKPPNPRIARPRGPVKAEKLKGGQPDTGTDHA